MDRLLTPLEAKDILRVGTNQVYAIFDRPDFPTIKLGKSRLFVKESALMAWLDNRENKRIKALEYLQILVDINKNSLTKGEGITEEAAELIDLDDVARWLACIQAGEITREQVVEKIIQNMAWHNLNKQR